MRFSSRSGYRLSVRAGLVLAIGFLATSCAESKISQCKKLIDVANQVVSDVQTVAQNASSTTGTPANSDSSAVINRVASAADQAKSRMESLNLADPKLKEFQGRYATMYTEIGQTTRDMLKAADTNNREAGKNAYDAFKQATSQEGALVDEINAYCAR